MRYVRMGGIRNLRGLLITLTDQIRNHIEHSGASARTGNAVLAGRLGVVGGGA